MKLDRQTKIIELIEQQPVETQEELAKLLMASGYYVTQATISRDIRELKLTKLPNDEGIHRYVVLSTPEKNLTEKYIKVLRNCYVSMDKAQGMIVIKTLTGMAMAVAAALDALDYSELVGCIAGDDTIFCAVRTEEQVLELMNKIKKVVD